jgi:hypothetical protein
MHQPKALNLQISNELHDIIGNNASVRNNSSLLSASHQF